MNTQVDLAVVRLFPAISRNTNANGVDVDLKNYDVNRNLKVIVDVGEATTAGTLDFKIQTGAATDSYADLDTTSFTQSTNSTGLTTFHVRTNKRYLRAVQTIGSSGVYVASAAIILPARYS